MKFSGYLGDSNTGAFIVTLITGATGFIGSHLVHSLARQGHNVYGLTRRKLVDSTSVKWLTYDGSPQSIVTAVQESKPDVVFHLAARFIAEHKFDQIEELVETNLTFSTQLLDAMSAHGCKKIVCAGTSWQNFNGQEGIPSCLYAATKQAFESILKFYVDAHQVQAVILKIFDTYGTNDPRRKLLGILREAALSGNAIGLSPGDQEIDLLHVEDAAGAFISAMSQFKTGNIGFLRDFYLRSETSLSLKSLVKLINEVSDHKVKAIWGEREYREREVMKTWKEGATLPGWQPRISLQQGLKDYFSSAATHV